LIILPGEKKVRLSVTLPKNNVQSAFKTSSPAAQFVCWYIAQQLPPRQRKTTSAEKIPPKQHLYEMKM